MLALNIDVCQESGVRALCRGLKVLRLIATASEVAVISVSLGFARERLVCDSCLCSSSVGSVLFALVAVV